MKIILLSLILAALVRQSAFADELTADQVQQFREQRAPQIKARKTRINTKYDSIAIIDIAREDIEANYGTFYAAGADTVFLLSSKSNKNVDYLQNSIYGFSQIDLQEKILPNTSSSVRGEELIELLNLIVRYLVAHVHALPGTAPVPVARDGTSATEILFQLQNAANKVLNPNIRIN